MSVETEVSYPFSVGVDGDLVVTDDRPTQCGQAILAALLTLQGERVYRPEFGLETKVLSTNRVGEILGQVRTTLRASLAEGYPDCTYQLSGVLADDGRVIVITTYQVADAPKVQYKVEVPL